MRNGDARRPQPKPQNDATRGLWYERPLGVVAGFIQEIHSPTSEAEAADERRAIIEADTMKTEA